MVNSVLLLRIKKKNKKIMFLDGSFSTSLSIMPLSSTEKTDCGRRVLCGRVSNSIVAPLTDVKISLSEVIICQLLMDLVMQPARK